MAIPRPVTRVPLRLYSTPICKASSLQLQWRRLVHSSSPSSLSKAVVTDDHIAELSAKPLHPLTLGDLAKYVYLLGIIPSSTNNIAPDMAALLSPQTSSSTLRTLPSPSFQPGWPTESNLSRTSL